MTTAQFKVDLARGKAGERWLADRTGLRFPADGERRWDLEGGVVGRPNYMRVEVKTDSYDPLRTPNFFMELLTVVGGRELVGGPWRARADGVDTFVYLYHSPDRSPSWAYWFYDLPALVAELDRNPSRWQMRAVKLDQLRATGLLVPRTKLSHLYTQVRYDHEGS